MDFLWPIIGLAAMSFWGWLAVQVIKQGRKLVELEEKINSREDICQQRLEWLRRWDKKLDRVAEDTAAIRVALGESPHA